MSLDVASVECLNQGTNDLDLEGGLILSRTQLVCLLCHWIACVAGLMSRRGLMTPASWGPEKGRLTSGKRDGFARGLNRGRCADMWVSPHPII